jgi:drug/metabolite transporter (DMT)-like permease
VAVFGEKLPITIWLAVACIFIGIALVTLTARAQD